MPETDNHTDVVGELSWSTEQRNPRTRDLDQLAPGELVATILSEDAQVAGAVQAVQQQIGHAVELAVAALAAGGRIHYVGSGTGWATTWWWLTWPVGWTP